MSKKPHVKISRNFPYVLPVVVAWSLFDENAIRFHVMGPVGHSQRQRRSVEFARWRHWGQVAVYDCRLVLSCRKETARPIDHSQFTFAKNYS